MSEIKVPPPDHVKFTKQGRAYADMDRLIDRELERVSGEKPISEWQPISTAPKDTRILAYNKEWDERVVVLTLRGGAWAAGYAPTHWMPLPDPPK